MLDKRTRGAVWIAFVLLANIALIGYLRVYTGGRGADSFVFGLPEAFVVLVGFVFTVTAINAFLGWYYLGKPHISEIYSSERGGQTDETPNQRDMEGT